MKDWCALLLEKKKMFFSSIVLLVLVLPLLKHLFHPVPPRPKRLSVTPFFVLFCFFVCLSLQAVVLVIAGGEASAIVLARNEGEASDRIEGTAKKALLISNVRDPYVYSAVFW